MYNPELVETSFLVVSVGKHLLTVKVLVPRDENYLLWLEKEA